MKNLSYVSLLLGTVLLAAPSDGIGNGPTIGGNVSNSSENKSVTISIGGASFKNKGSKSSSDMKIGSTTGTETDTGNIKIESGKITQSVVNSSKNESLILNIGTKVQKGSINMTNGSAGSIVNSSSNKGAIISVGGGEMSLDTEGVSSTNAKIGNSENTETNVGSINVNGGTVLNEITNAGMKNSSSVTNIGGVVNKGAIKVDGGQAKSIQNSSKNSGVIVNIGGGELSTKSMGGLSEMDLKIGNTNTQTDVGSVSLDSGLVKGDVQNTSDNSATLINIGSTVKVGTIEIGK